MVRSHMGIFLSMKKTKAQVMVVLNRHKTLPGIY